jgi:nucleoside-diphosphate-sugar epimerase
VVIWGSGTPRREFLHVDDMADASLFVLDLTEAAYRQKTRPMLSHINVGTGQDISIAELAELIARVTGFSGRIRYDRSRPDGTPRKLLDVSRLSALGWRSTIGLEDGIRQTYQWFLDHVADGH